ncbi:hypothetical protein TgHK011_001867 [Trichoderma gracile]|nr:hypothetical protein TgHK011_001867 [Trichoderma gracile]
MLCGFSGTSKARQSTQYPRPYLRCTSSRTISICRIGSASVSAYRKPARLSCDTASQSVIRSLPDSLAAHLRPDRRCRGRQTPWPACSWAHLRSLFRRPDSPGPPYQVPVLRGPSSSNPSRSSIFLLFFYLICAPDCHVASLLRLFPLTACLPCGRMVCLLPVSSR